MGKVYFFTNGVNIKIGYTKGNIQKRLMQLNTGSDNQLYSLGYMTGDKNTENELHLKFANIRLRNNGEWFSADQHLIDYINSVNEVPNICVMKNEYFDNKVMACKTT